MSPEQPKKIEELLKRYAKERRERGDSFSVHPATRRLLQGEVARQFSNRRKHGSAWLDWLRTWRARLTVATTVIVALGIGIWSMREGAQQVVTPNEPRALAEAGSVARADKETQVAQEREVLVLKDATKPAASSEAKELRDETLEALGSRPKLASAIAANPTAPADRKVAADSVGFPVSDAAVSAPKIAMFDSLNRQGAPNTQDLQRLSETVADQPVEFRSVALANAVRDLSAKTELGVTVATNAVDQLNLSSGSANGVASLRPNEAVRENQTPEALKKVVEYQVANTESQARQFFSQKDLPTPSNIATQSLSEFAQVNFGRDVRGPTATAPQQLKAFELQNQVALTVSPPSSASTQAAPAEESVRQSGNLPQLKQADGIAIPVLTRFTVEQRAETIRLVDADSSVYEGPITATADIRASAEPERRLSRDETVRARTAPAPRRMITPASYSFRATGTNRTRGEPVIVTGRISRWPTNATAPGDAGSAEELVRSPAPGFAPPATSTTSVARFVFDPAAANTNAVAIEGTVRVGGSSEQQFKAVPVPR